ncbi:MAG TPA: hypothetical protein RMG48_13040 [Myxococcales bacterium LLY-WYZ-16_1]|jgi:hypothetical protein|nr:hypothetical protein [Myxococcales bacterium LLY-WYZ-16_1]
MWVGVAGASPGWLGPWAGEYRLDISSQIARERAADAVQRARGNLGGFVGAKAAETALVQTRAARVLHLATDLDRLRVELDGWQTAGPPNGMVEVVRGPKGEPMEMTLRFEPGVLLQRFRRGAWERTHRFRRRDGGGIVLEVQIRDPRFGRPIWFELPYRRAED